MTKSELIDAISKKHSHLGHKDVDLAVKSLLEQMAQSLSEGDRIEIRGFGSFSLHYRPPRKGRNPKTGESVPLSAKYVPHFKPGKELRDRVNGNRLFNKRLTGDNFLTTLPPVEESPITDAFTDAVADTITVTHTDTIAN